MTEEFKDLNIADVFILRYHKTEGGNYQQTYTPAEFDQMQEWLNDALAKQHQKPWVGLTDEDILKFQDIVPNTLGYDLIEFAHAIEAKLKEKNT
jgi:hypothetical protein